MPSVDDVLHPILVALSDGEPHEFSAVVDSVCYSLELDHEVRARRLSSGATVIENRAGWARTSLSKAGLVDHPRPSFLIMTEAGS